jgi:glycosyltransferase involved in cell wall biosynthesis
LIVAYDLRYADGHFTGIGTHAYALLAALLELPGDDRYVVLWNPRLQHARYDLTPFTRHPRVTWVERQIPPLHPAGLLSLGAWLRHVRPDVYFSPFYLLPWRAPCPCVLTLHDVWPLRLPGDFPLHSRLLFRLSVQRARSARFIVTSSEFSRQEILELVRASPDRVRSIPLGAPPVAATAASLRPERLPEGRFALVVGDNRPRKNLAVLARAWALLPRESMPFLVSVGPADPRYLTATEWAARTGTRHVIGLGWVSEKELAWLYEHADMLLFPSFYEGFGLPLVEAFQRGVPVVAADIPTLREVADNAAWFADPNRPQDWADAVARLSSDPEEREALRRAGRSRASELSYRDTAQRTRALFEEACALQPRGES